MADLSIESCNEALEADGSLRDIYVFGTTLDDWRKVLEMLSEARYGARLDDESLATALRDVPTLFVAQEEHPTSVLNFRVGRVHVACHFFTEQEIEFDFDPSGLAEADVHDVLDFMECLGTLTGKPVVLTPENVRDSPIFRYEPST